jgi:hypothetical protein
LLVLAMRFLFTYLLLYLLLYLIHMMWCMPPLVLDPHDVVLLLLNMLGVVHKVESLLLSDTGECRLFFDLAKSEYGFCSNFIFPSQIRNTIAFLHNSRFKRFEEF